MDNQEKINNVTKQSERTKDSKKIIIPIVVILIFLVALFAIYNFVFCNSKSIFLRAINSEYQKLDDKLNKIVRTRIISVEEKMHYVRSIIKEKEDIRFTSLITDYEKDEIIATFLSVLELIKSNEVTVVQDLFFDDILIKRNMES